MNVVHLKQQYMQWKQDSFASKRGFFPVFKEFVDYMPHLSPGAISLFLYIGLHSNNSTGESYHSLSTMAEYFGVTPRTISNWVNELVKIGLIERTQFYGTSVAHTYLRPYPNDKIKEFIDGD